MSAHHCHDHCSPDAFEGMSAAYKRTLWAVIAINAAMFLVELTAGVAAGSMALQSDALDFLADSATYGITLLVIGRSLQVRAGAALFKGASLFLMALYVLAATVYRVFVLGVPEAMTMSVVGVLALAANLASVLLLYRFRDGDANVRSVWLCSRNDAIGNVAVVIAAAGVFATDTGWPDLIVAAIMASLFLHSAGRITRQALAEMRASRRAPASPSFITET